MSVATQPQPLNHLSPVEKPAAREIRVVTDSGPLAFLMDTARFEHMHRIAQAMALGKFIPAHMRETDKAGTIANCFRVVNQAVRWGMDPFAMIDTTYEVYGRLGYEGKLVAAVVNSRAGLTGGLHPYYNTKKNDDFAIVVYGCEKPIPKEAYDLLEGYAEADDKKALNGLERLGVMAVRLSFGQGKTFEKDGKTIKAAWSRDPEQKLFYSGVTKWARRWRPELLLGVLTEDDMERMATSGAIPQEIVPPVGRQWIGVRTDDDGRQRVPDPAFVEAEAKQETSPQDESPADDVQPEQSEQTEQPATSEQGPDPAALADFIAEQKGYILGAQRAGEALRVRDFVEHKDQDWIGAEARKELVEECNRRAMEFGEKATAPAKGGKRTF